MSVSLRLPRETLGIPEGPQDLGDICCTTDAFYAADRAARCHLGKSQDVVRISRGFQEGLVALPSPPPRRLAIPTFAYPSHKRGTMMRSVGRE